MRGEVQFRFRPFRDRWKPNSSPLDLVTVRLENGKWKTFNANKEATVDDSVEGGMTVEISSRGFLFWKTYTITPA